MRADPGRYVGDDDDDDGFGEVERPSIGGFAMGAGEDMEEDDFERVDDWSGAAMTA